MSLLPRFVTHDFVASDFAPVWRLLDNYANQVASARQNSAPHTRSSFSPRFDVKEVEGGYELKGDLPGVEQSNIEIEFPDQRTIVIKGSTGYSREEGRPSSEVTQEQPVEEATPSEKSSHQATVEDEPEYVDAGADTATEEASATASTQATPASTPAQPVEQTTPAQSSRYWVSERYTGQFQRVFTFPAPVDTENTTARLQNGILEVVIPKVPKAGIKRISIQ